MPNRVIKDWTASEKIDRLSSGAEILFTRLIMKADDYGNYVANAKLIKAALFPLKDHLPSEINSWLEECKKANLIVFYKVKGTEYIHILNFDQKLRRMKNTYPPPSDGDLRTSDGQMTDKRGQMTAETKRNESETEEEGEGEFSLQIQTASFFNKKYDIPAKRGTEAFGQDIDMMVERLRKDGLTDAEIFAQCQSMVTHYRKQGWPVPTNIITIITKIQETDWIKTLKESNPEFQATQTTFKNAEPDTIGTSEYGSLG